MRLGRAVAVLAAVTALVSPSLGLGDDDAVKAAFAKWGDAAPKAIGMRRTDCVVTRSSSCQVLGVQIQAWNRKGRTWLSNAQDGSETAVVRKGIRQWRTSLGLYDSLSWLLKNDRHSRKLGPLNRRVLIADSDVLFTFVVELDVRVPRAS